MQTALLIIFMLTVIGYAICFLVDHFFQIIGATVIVVILACMLH